MTLVWVACMLALRPAASIALQPVRRAAVAKTMTTAAGASPQIWLMKNEPEEYSLDHLQRDVVGVWDGIRNYQARNFMRSMKIGDKAYFYYSSCAQPGIYGVMRVAGPSFPDPKALDRTSDYYDARAAAAGKNPWDAISLRMDCRFATPLLLPRIRELPLGECRLTARGNRLSIFPLTEEQAAVIDEELAALNAAPGSITYGDSSGTAPSPPAPQQPQVSDAKAAVHEKTPEKKPRRKRPADAAAVVEAPVEEAKKRRLASTDAAPKKASKKPAAPSAASKQKGAAAAAMVTTKASAAKSDGAAASRGRRR